MKLRKTAAAGLLAILAALPLAAPRYRILSPYRSG
jgi:hypothetical protein